MSCHRMLRIVWRCFALALCTLFFTAQAESLRLDESSHRFDAAGHLFLLRDAATLDVQEAAHSKNWNALPASLNAGFTTDVIWLKLTLDAAAHPHGGWILKFGNALLDDVKVYVGQQDGWTLLGASGEDVARMAWPFEYRSAAFQLPEFAEAGSQVLMIRLQSKNALASSVEIWPRLAFDNATRRETLFYGLYFGFYLLLIGLHAVFWVATRASMSGLFLAYIGIGVCNEAFSLGLLQQITHLSVHWSDRLLGAGIAVNVMVALLVAVGQLELTRLYPRLIRFLIIACSALIGVSLLLVMAGQYGSAMHITQPLALLLMVFFFLLGSYLCWRGWQSARFFLLAFGPFYAGIVVAFLRNLGVLPVNWLTENMATFCGMFHMLLLSFYIIGRHESKRRQNERQQAHFAANLARQHSAQLEREVKSRTADLQQEIRRRELLEDELRSSLQLERKVRAEQRDFVAMVSHEFRTPLAIIGTSAQQLSRNLAASVEKNQARCNNIRSAALRLLGLVDEYLSDDRMSGEDSVVRPVVCDFHVVLDELLQEFTPGRIVATSTSISGQLFSDVSLLRIALRNLLSNADRYAPVGDVIRVNLHVDGDDLCMDIANSGESIIPSEQERLFQKYYRGNNVQHRPGAGLGLYLVRRIAEQLGGQVNLVSAGGAEPVCFRFRIPRSTSPSSAD